MRFVYNLDLVAMSVIVAMMASYVALDLAGRVTHTEGRAARYWLVGGAVAMGAGIWSMHFIGMLAVKMPIQLGYDPLLTAASLLIAVVTSGFALAVVSRKTLKTVTLLVGGVVMGAGICGMHYTGMAAMRMVPAIRYEPLLFGTSVLIAVCAAIAALWLAFTLRSADTSRSMVFKLLAAVVMGVAISGMHYTGMQAARFAPDSVCTAAVRLATDNSYLGQSIGVMMMVILSLTLLASVFDARLGARTTRMLRDLHESEEKYRSLLETTRDVVLLVDEASTIRYASPTVESVFGYRPEELVGQALVMLQPERLRQPHLQGFQRYLGSGVRKLDWRAIEVPGLRRDGREIPLELAFSEVCLDGKRLFSGFVRDISERKERETRIARLNRMQAVLSGINSLIVCAHSRQGLFDEACRVAVEQGQFRMVMIGMVSGDEFHPVSVYGVDDGYVRENIRLTLSGADSKDAGPTASALRDRRESVCNDIAGDPTMAPWREAALQRGYRASASFPLLEGVELAGCISLYATEVGFFDAEELKLLSELAGDISHALGVIARDEQLDYLAYYDPLTRLANRKLFVQRLEQVLESARQNRSGLALVQLDVLRFAAVNDAVGRAGGDEALKLLADRIVGFAGSPSHVARIHGDCFAMVFPELRSPDLLQHQLEPLLAMLGRPVVVSDKELRIGASAGIALFPEDGDDANTLLRNAEAALKMAKSEHEGFLFYTREMGAAISEKRSLEGKLRRAFERHEFVLHYQPKVALNSGAICGVEALIRWNSPDLGLVPPERFVPLLEETGLILEVGHWALQQAAADYRDWRAQGLRAPRVAVNLSPIQLRRPDFVERLRAALGESVADGSGVDLEITESVLMTDIERHIAKLNAVRQLGVSIAIDDFGTGYSSLAYLNKLPITAVKIDRSFVMQMADSADTMNIVSTIISLAHSMSLRVVAEGVDSAEQLRFLRLLRCDEMQGFLFSKGLAKEEFEQLLREDRRLALS